MGVISKWCVLLAVFGTACTKKINECNVDSDCKDIAYPFCDVDGQYAASGGEHNVCTITPPDCPVDRCGCAPGAASCSNSNLETCNSDGKSTTSTTCNLGCATTGDRCFTFKPSNGLDAAMNASPGTTAATLTHDVTIDTDACTATDTTMLPLPVKTLKLAQVSGPGICAIVAESFELGNVTATGTIPLALVAPGPIKISGTIDVAAHWVPRGTYMGGPGSQTVGACVPLSNVTVNGGGGNGMNGGDGLLQTSVPTHRPGGLAQTTFSPLAGGCFGGDASIDASGGVGGGGGGALQLVSLTSVELTPTGLLALGGGGGFAGGGGGSGGTAIIEAPVVTILGGVAANGGGGGFNNAGCQSDGSFATNDAIPAPGGPQTCAPMTQHGGAGGVGGIAAQNGTINGGGGGAVGRILVRTADGTFNGPGALFSVVATMDTLAKI